MGCGSSKDDASTESGAPKDGAGSPPSRQKQKSDKELEAVAAAAAKFMREIFDKGAKEEKLDKADFNKVLSDAGLPFEEAFMGMFGGDAKEADKDEDGKISFDEFKQFFDKHYVFTPETGTFGPKPPASPPASAPATAETPAKPAAETPAKPAAKTPAKPAAETPAKPAADAPTKPAADAPAKPAADTPAASAPLVSATPSAPAKV